jgi:hypothetical protein
MRVRRGLLGVSLVTALIAACATTDESVDRAKCERLRDHMIDLRLSGLAQTPAFASPTKTPPPPSAGAPDASRIPPYGSNAGPLEHPPDTRSQPISEADLKAHRQAMQQALGEDFLTSCQKSLSATQLRCALAANDVGAAAACSSPAPTKTN